VKTRADVDIEILERRLLHALLIEHDGMKIADVVCELEVTPQKANELLASEQRDGGVDLNVNDFVYLSLRKTKTATAEALRSELSLARRNIDAARARKRAILLIAGPIAAGVIALAWWGATYTPSPPTQGQVGGTAPSPPVVRAESPSLDERVNARLAGEQRRQWEIEAADRERRIAALDAAATAASCANQWNKGASCYVSHRNMSRAEFDEERATLASELARLRRLLDLSRQ